MNLPLLSIPFLYQVNYPARFALVTCDLGIGRLFFCRVMMFLGFSLDYYVPGNGHLKPKMKRWLISSQFQVVSVAERSVTQITPQLRSTVRRAQAQLAAQQPPASSSTARLQSRTVSPMVCMVGSLKPSFQASRQRRYSRHDEPPLPFQCPARSPHLTHTPSPSPSPSGFCLPPLLGREKRGVLSIKLTTSLSHFWPDDGRGERKGKEGKGPEDRN